MKMVKVEESVHARLKELSRGRRLSDVIQASLDGTPDPLDRIYDQLKMLHDRLDELS